MNQEQRSKIKNQAVNDYKIYWLDITKACNNQCIFCLDKDNKKDYFIDLDTVKQRLDFAIKDKYNKLVISGGDASIHPQLFNILKLVKRYNFDKVQIISNGRMFADKKFTLNCLKLGINEFTLSLHSHKLEIQDELFGIKGGGKQAQQGLTNIVKLSKILKIPSIVNIDIVINKLNVKDLLEIIKYYSQKFGVYEFDLLYPVPFGAAYENKDQVFFDLDKNFKYIKQVLDFYHNNTDFFIWLNRFPVEYLSGYEDLIQDPKKIKDEVNGRRQLIDNLIKNKQEFNCRQSERCDLCNLKHFCNILHDYFLNFDEICKTNQQKVNDSTKCLNDNDQEINNSKLSDIYPSENIDEIVDYYLKNLYKVKSIECKKCKYYEKCEGIHIDKVREEGFKILKPIIK